MIAGLLGALLLLFQCLCVFGLHSSVCSIPVMPHTLEAARGLIVVANFVPPVDKPLPHKLSHGLVQNCPANIQFGVAVSNRFQLCAFDHGRALLGGYPASTHTGESHVLFETFIRAYGIEWLSGRPVSHNKLRRQFSNVHLRFAGVRDFEPEIDMLGELGGFDPAIWRAGNDLPQLESTPLVSVLPHSTRAEEHDISALHFNEKSGLQDSGLSLLRCCFNRFSEIIRLPLAMFCESSGLFPEADSGKRKPSGKQNYHRIRDSDVGKKPHNPWRGIVLILAALGLAIGMNLAVGDRRRGLGYLMICVSILAPVIVFPLL